MPARILRAPPPPPPVVAPARVAIALRPSVDRSDIPNRVTLSTNAPPFAGELREEQMNRMSATAVLPVGGTMSIATLRRAWNFVGFIVDPGNASSPGLTASLRILTRGLNGVLASVAIAPNAPPQAFTNFIVGARCELILTNGSLTPLSLLAGSLWGMGER